MTLLQVALDFTRIEDALAVVERVKAHVDHFECGTPLLKAEGVRAIQVINTLAKLNNQKTIADLKTLDTGFLEFELAYQAGADFVTVAGGAPVETILGALEAKQKYGKGIIIDLIGADPLAKAEEFERMRIDKEIDFLEIHRAIDQAQAVKFDAFLEQIRALKKSTRTALAVAGGLDEVTAPMVVPFTNLIVVGGAITKAKDPAEAADRLRRAIELRREGRN